MEKIMIRHVICAALLMLAATPCISAKSVETPSVTKTLVSCFNRLGNLPPSGSGQASEMAMQIRNGFGANLNLDGNEFYIIGMPGERPRLTSQTYSNKLKSYLFDNRSLKMDCQIVSTVPVNAIELGKDAVAFNVTLLQKQLQYAGNSYSIWQEVDVDIETSKITSITSSNRKPDKNEFIETDGHEDLSPQEYLNRAAKFYSKKRYDQAYKAYADLTEKYPAEAEGWYRLSLMIYKQRGCKGIHSKPQTTAHEYMKKAYNLARGKLKTKAENILYYWEHPNYM